MHGPLNGFRDPFGRPVAQRGRVCVCLMMMRVLLVLRAPSRAKPMAQVVWISAVAAAVLHAISAHYCTVKACRDAGDREN